MTRAERKRRAATAAVALLEWRDQMRRVETARADAERTMTARYETFIAEMRAQADKPHVASQAPCKLTMAMVRGDGAAGVLS